MKQKFKFYLCIAFVTLCQPQALAGPTATLPTQIQIHGTLQLWTRTCDKALKCSNPEASGNPIEINGKISAPNDNRTLGYFIREIDLQDYDAVIELFWKSANSSVEKAYLASQILVKTNARGEAIRAVVECSFYDAVQEGPYFPVGACSGAQPGSQGITNGQSKYIGVTFKRF